MSTQIIYEEIEVCFHAGKEFKKFGKKIPIVPQYPSSENSMDFRSSSEYSDSDSNATVHSNWEKDFQRGGEKGNHNLDNLINTNLRAESNKVSVNDIRSHESKTRPEINQPTSVTYLNVRGGTAHSVNLLLQFTSHSLIFIRLKPSMAWETIGIRWLVMEPTLDLRDTNLVLK